MPRWFPRPGSDRTLTVTDAKRARRPAQADLALPEPGRVHTCHNPWAGYTLAFTLPSSTRITITSEKEDCPSRLKGTVLFTAHRR